jgi:hypothetical protein
MNYLKEAVYFIEANSFEELSLYEENERKGNYMNWIDIHEGGSKKIGKINDNDELPVYLTFSFAKIYDQVICFFDVSSRFSDSEMVRNYIKDCYEVKHDSQQVITNAMNFHHAVHTCERLREKNG